LRRGDGADALGLGNRMFFEGNHTDIAQVDAVL
jgi:hypothetical protein